MQDELRPKVFISCGQHTEDERGIARQIADELSKLGFEPFVAVMEQTVEGLKNNLFRQLETSEYFLFIDFKRDQFANSAEHRGSLFTNQELAIASFLGLEAIGFQEEGVRRLDGMLGAMQLNAESFADRSALVAQVLQRVDERWTTGWKNGLRFETSQPSHNDAFVGKNPCRFHFLSVHNLHNRKSADNCQVFCKSLRRLGSDRDLLKAATELKWTGYPYPEARIRPGTSRSFDSLVQPLPCAEQSNQGLGCTTSIMPMSDVTATPTFGAVGLRSSQSVVGYVNGFTDASDYVSRLEGAGEYDIEFEVTSSNFPTARCRARVTLGVTVDESKVELPHEEPGSPRR